MLLLLIVLGLLPPATTPAPPAVLRDAPTSDLIQWMGGPEADLGTLEAGREAVHVFYFKNSTNDALLIENVRVGCGCTATDWVDTPVQPGETGELRVTYDAGKRGYFRKYVKVFFYERRGGHKLWLTGFVR